MNNLRAFLADNGITQMQFASMVGTTQANVSKLCGDDPKISPELAARIEAVTKGAVPVEAWPKFAVFARRHAEAIGASPARDQGEATQ